MAEEKKMEEKRLVTTDMLVGDIIKEYPDAAFALMQCGMGCISCPAAQSETLEEAAMVHGLPVEEVLNYVNERISMAEAMMQQGIN